MSLERKLKEVQVAFELERAYSKDEILEAYMNEIYLGPGWWGVQTASRNYFGKDAVELDPAEAALLAAVGNNAGLYSPFRYPERAEARRNLVLDRMAREGFLTASDADLWKEKPLPTQTTAATEGSAPYFVEWVRQLLQERFGSQLYTGGYQITTTLDVGMQRAAELTMARGFDRIESRPGYPHITYAEFVEDADGEPIFDVETPYVQGMFIAMDPLTGGVRAMIGGRDFTHSKFNRAMQAMRQPGSSFKPIVYSAALASGIPASRIIADRAFVHEQVSGELWTPENFSDEFEGNMTLRHAFRNSVNTVAIRLAFEEVGVETVAQNARRLGIRTPIPRVPSIAIGSAEVLPIQMVEAYSAFATLGTKVQPIPVVRVESPEGEIVWEPDADRVQVMDPAAARLMVTLMEDVVNLGTGGAVRSRAGLPYSVPAAGKTGTTNRSTDLWFNGFTPNLQAAVWFGMDQPQPLYAGATSGEATPVWGEFMRLVYFGELAGAGELTSEAVLGEGEEPMADPAEPGEAVLLGRGGDEQRSLTPADPGSVADRRPYEPGSGSRDRISRLPLVPGRTALHGILHPGNGAFAGVRRYGAGPLHPPVAVVRAGVAHGQPTRRASDPAGDHSRRGGPDVDVSRRGLYENLPLTPLSVSSTRPIMSSANSSHQSDAAFPRSPAARCSRSLVLYPDPGTRTIAIPVPMRAPHTRPAKKSKRCTSSLYSIVATNSRSSPVCGSPLRRGRRGTVHRIALDPSADADTTATRDGSPCAGDTCPPSDCVRVERGKGHGKLGDRTVSAPEPRSPAPHSRAVRWHARS